MDSLFFIPVSGVVAPTVRVQTGRYFVIDATAAMLLLLLVSSRLPNPQYAAEGGSFFTRLYFVLRQRGR